MNFRKTTDDLFAKVSHEDLADALGVSVASIRQARLAEGALAKRNPPKGWEAVVLRLAEKKVNHFQRLVERIRAAGYTGD